MLMVAPREKSRVSFRFLGVSLEQDRVDSNCIGACMRAVEELASVAGDVEGDSVAQLSDGRTLRPHRLHRLNNLLHTAILTLDVLRLQMDAGRMREAGETLERAIAALRDLDHWLDRSTGSRHAPSVAP